MIGVFDSGVGGLTVAKEIKEALPESSILYLGDTARVPYGSKSKDLIQQFSLEIVDFLIGEGAKVIVIGCNTASANAAELIREKYPDVIVYDVIQPAVKTAATKTKNKKIGIIGTEATIASHVYREQLKSCDAELELHEEACPLFVPLVEENRIHTSETRRIIESYLGDLRGSEIDTLILGCTHYPYLKEDIDEYLKELGKDVQLIDTGHEVAQQIKDDVARGADKYDEVFSGEGDAFYLTDITESRIELAKKLFSREIHFKNATL